MANGLHHVTAIAGPARRNAEFYTKTLGLRLVKKTVNFDDPGTYHFYYADESGNPGTVMTFFPWAHAAPGRLGTGETKETLFRVPLDSLGYWIERFVSRAVVHSPIETRFGERVLPFRDIDGSRLALVGVPGLEIEPAWTEGVAAPHAIRGFHSVVLLLSDAAPTGAILSDVLGFAETGREGGVVRYQAKSGAPGSIVDLHIAETAVSQLGGGSVHHIAFRAADDAAQSAMVRKLVENHNIRTTEQKDRNYFRSVYFREPGGILFEIATDIPGFAADEPLAALGQSLKLPASLEPRRAQIEALLPDIT